MPPLLWARLSQRIVNCCLSGDGLSWAESGPWGVNSERKLLNVLFSNSKDLTIGDTQLTQVNCTKYIWSALIAVAIFFRHQELRLLSQALPAQCLESSDDALCSLIGQPVTSPGLWLVTRAHMGRVLTDLDSHLSQARMTDPGPEVLSGPRQAQGRGFCSLHKLLKTDTRHTPLTAEIILAGYPIRYFLEASQKIWSFLKSAWEVKCCFYLFFYRLLHSSWSDEIWLKSIVCMHIYAFLYLSTRRLVHM